MSNTASKRERGAVTILAADAQLEGKLCARGAVRVEGAVLGTVTAPEVLVAEKAGVLGEVHAEHVTVRGTLLGLAFARDRLHVAASGVIRGHARYAALEVERGGVVEGSSTAAVGEAEAKVFLQLCEDAAR
jgi:cytoskeletal protein CcmA (bactofilin family)